MLREALELPARAAVLVARLLRANLVARDLLAARLQARLDPDLLLRARAQLGGEPLAGVAVCDQLGVEQLDARLHRAAGCLERGCEPLGGWSQALVGGELPALLHDRPLALAALALGALGEAVLRGQRGFQLAPPRRRRPVVGRRAPLLDHVAGVPLALERLVAGASGGARGAIGLVARGVGGLDALAGSLDSGQRDLLGPGRQLDLLDHRSAPVALGQHAVLTAGGNLAQLARAG